MLVYIVIYLFILFCMFRKKDDIYSYVLLLLMFLVTILRSEEVGADTWTYLYNFGDYYNNGDTSSRSYELINNLLYYYLRLYNMDMRIILYVYGFITYLFIYMTCKRYGIKLAYFLFFFMTGSFFIMGLNITRQISSVMIVVYSIPLIYEKKIIKKIQYIALILFAGSIHSSSFLYFLFLFIPMIRIRKDVMVVIVSLFAFLILTRVMPVNEWIAKLTPEAYSVFKNSINNAYSISILGYLFSAFIVIVQLLIMWYSNDDKYNSLYSICILTSCVNLGLNSDVSRLFLVCEGFMMVYYCRYFAKHLPNSMAKILLWILMVTSTYFWYSGTSTNTTVNNYKTMFEDVR